MTQPIDSKKSRGGLLRLALGGAAAAGLALTALRRRGDAPSVSDTEAAPDDAEDASLSPWTPGEVIEAGSAAPSDEPAPRGFPVLLGLLGICLFALLAALALAGSGAANLSPLTSLVLAGFALALTGLYAARNLSFMPVTLGASLSTRAEAGSGWRAGFRLLTLAAALALSYQASQISDSGQFTDSGLQAWAVSIILWFILLSDRTVVTALEDLSERAWAFSARHLFRRELRIHWSLLLFALIFVVAVWFRFNDQTAYPTDMNWDLSHKALDVLSVVQGSRPVFFESNSGREPFQFYFLAFLHNITDIPISLNLLTLASGLEGLVLVVLAWWMGRALFGAEDRRLGNLTGLIMAGLIATSFWHTMLSRSGLRIVLTTLMSTLVFVFLVRALRSNRRLDFLLTGLVLGASVYTYQAARIFPLLVVAGVGLTLAFYPAARRQWRGYLVNTAALVILSLVVFVPLGMYMLRFPEQFWQRTAQNVVGDTTFNDASGSLLQQNLANLGSTAAQGLLMLNYQGDNSPFYGTPTGRPELDPVVSALFIMGLGLMVVRIVRRRDPLDLLLPVGVLILLLPTILSISDVPTEVPSASRASGSLPLVYLIAALALAVIVTQFARLRVAGLRYLVFAAIGLLLVSSTITNAGDIFGTLSDVQKPLRFPFRQAGQIVRDFLNSTGAPGNVFVVYSPSWIDARLVWMEAGLDPTLTSDIGNTDPLGGVLIRIQQHHDQRRDEFLPDRQLLFIVSRLDEVGAPLLESTFPGGSWIPVATYNPEADFRLYVVPALGCDWVRAQTVLVVDQCPPA